MDESQINIYKKSLISKEKVEILGNLLEHYQLYNFLSFNQFEWMDVDSLVLMEQLVHSYADRVISKDVLCSVIRKIADEQKNIKKEIPKLFTNYIDEYFKQEIINSIQSMNITFVETGTQNAICGFSLEKMCLLGQIEEKYLEEINKMDYLFLYDKTKVKVEVNHYNGIRNIINVDFKNNDISAKYSVLNLMNQVIDEDKIARKFYQNIQEIKLEWKANRNTDQFMEQIKIALQTMNYKESYPILDRITTKEDIVKMLANECTDDLDNVKGMLKHYDAKRNAKYYLLDKNRCILPIHNQNVEELYSEIECMDSVKKFRSWDCSRKYLLNITNEDKESLISACNKNIWLNTNAIKEDGMDENDYPYSFCKCNEKLDLLNYFEHGNWALRDGIIYQDLAFIQQVNGGDEFLALVKQGNKWIQFESISFHTVIENRDFYSFIEDIKKCSEEKIKERVEIRKQEDVRGL